LVLAAEGLIGDLSARDGIPSAMAGVDDHLAVIPIVRIPAGQDDALGSFLGWTDNPGLCCAMDASGSKIGPRREDSSRYNVEEFPNCHAVLLSRHPPDSWAWKGDGLPIEAPWQCGSSAIHAGAGGVFSRAISDRISWNICRGTTTSAIWKVTYRP